MLEMGQGTLKHGIALKYNPSWFGEHEFQDFVKASWKHYDGNLDDSTCS